MDDGVCCHCGDADRACSGFLQFLLVAESGRDPATEEMEAHPILGRFKGADTHCFAASTAE